MARPVKEDDLDPVGREMLDVIRKVVAYAYTGANCTVCCGGDLPDHQDDCPVPAATRVMERLGIDWEAEVDGD